MLHQPVMLNQVIELLAPCPAGVMVDATVGAGGHLKGIFEAYGAKFKYFGFDLDGLILGHTRKILADCGLEAELIKANYTDITDILKKKGYDSISAALFDFGIGSHQIDDSSRGFSYLEDGPLTMSFDEQSGQSAAAVIKNLDEKQLASLFKSLGQEKKARLLAKRIKNSPVEIATTGQLAGIIRDTVGDRFFVKTASRVFQALRIAVNHELDNISRGLEQTILGLAAGGRLIAISYHSLEDGLVKRMFKKYSGRCVCPAGVPQCNCGKVKLVKIITGKPLGPDPEECRQNPRARSARLRVVEKIGEAA
jgi:16S rRNA (cytosine1402-N4)-methyltransferase